MKVAIVDDEPLARERIRTLLAHEADVEVVAECGEGRLAVEAVQALRPDLLFLDVQMPGMDGFDVLTALGVPRLPITIFVTAYDRYAIQAFEVNAVDYLLKPFSPKRLRAALDRARRELEKADGQEVGQRLVSMLEHIGGAKKYQRQLVVKQAGRIVFVRVEEIDWIEAEGNYVRLHAGGTSYLIRETMKGIETKLDPEQFVRIHRSTIVQADRIRELQPLFHGEHAVILRNGVRLVASRGPDNRLKRLIDEGTLKG